MDSEAPVQVADMTLELFEVVVKSPLHKLVSMHCSSVGLDLRPCQIFRCPLVRKVESELGCGIAAVLERSSIRFPPCFRSE